MIKILLGLFLELFGHPKHDLFANILRNFSHRTITIQIFKFKGFLSLKGYLYIKKCKHYFYLASKAFKSPIIIICTFCISVGTLKIISFKIVFPKPNKADYFTNINTITRRRIFVK